MAKVFLFMLSSVTIYRARTLSSFGEHYPVHPKLLPYTLCSSVRRSDSGLYYLASAIFLDQILIQNSIHSAFPVTTEDRNMLVF